jgi:hypothetical protein
VTLGKPLNLFVVAAFRCVVHQHQSRLLPEHCFDRLFFLVGSLCAFLQLMNTFKLILSLPALRGICGGQSPVATAYQTHNFFTDIICQCIFIFLFNFLNTPTVPAPLEPRSGADPVHFVSYIAEKWPRRY